MAFIKASSSHNLTSKPNITYFRKNYHRHTAYNELEVELTRSSSTPSLGQTVVYEIDEPMDLMKYICVRTKLPPGLTVEDVGEKIVSRATLLDENQEEFISMTSEEIHLGAKIGISNYGKYKRLINGPYVWTFIPFFNLTHQDIQVYAPLRKMGIKYLVLEFAPLNQFAHIQNPQIRVFYNGVHLCSAEAHQWDQGSVESLFNKFQTAKYPVQYMCVTCRLPFNDVCQMLCLSAGGKVIESLQIMVDGEPYLPKPVTGDMMLNHNDLDLDENDIYCYLFCLNPKEHQPSGCLNLGQHDVDIVVQFSEPTNKLTVYALTYQILGAYVHGSCIKNTT